MITKQQLADAMIKECDICIHLHSKLGADSAEYRPGPGQRSTVELLRYLAASAIGGMTSLKANDWNNYGEYAGRVKDMTVAEFPAAMTRMRDEIKAFFANTTDAELQQDATMFGGYKAPLAYAILIGPFKWLTAYKLQLFLYAKASGAAAIGTSNAWGGMDAKPAA